MLNAIRERLGIAATGDQPQAARSVRRYARRDPGSGLDICGGGSENLMNLITTYLLFIVIPVALGFVVNVLALLLLVNADLLWPDLARGGRQ